VRKPIENDDLISFVVSGLNPLFNTFVTIYSFTAHDTEMSFADFQSELLNHEMLLENQQHKTVTPKTGSFALYTNKQGPSNFDSANLRKPRFPPRLNPRSQHFSAKNNNGYSLRGNGGYSTSNQPTPFTPLVNSTGGNSNQQGNSTMSTNQTSHNACQICGKSNHIALDYFHRMDCTYQGRHPPSQLATMAAQVNEDFKAQDWLADSGANTYIIANPSNINNPQPFGGTETVRVGNGTGLDVNGIGSSLVHCKPSNSFNLSQFLLKDILYCPNASANLLSINKFCIDNNCWFALTSSNFFCEGQPDMGCAVPGAK
jgi:hypothetical protein